MSIRHQSEGSEMDEIREAARRELRHLRESADQIEQALGEDLPPLTLAGLLTQAHALAEDAADLADGLSEDR